MITWFTDSAQREGKWGLGGFVEKADPNVEALRRQKGATFFFDVSGIEFIVDGPMHYLNVLEGATLDYVDEGFVLKVI